MQTSTKRPVAFVLTSTNHGSMLTNRHDYRLVGNSGYGVGYQLLTTSCFDENEINTALHLLESRKKNFGPGVVAIDCGANIGVHTLEWAKRMYGWGEVLAFEAQERIFYALAGNIALNNCFNARVIWAAVGAEQGQIGVPIPDYFSPSSYGSLEIRQKDSNEFIGQTIDYSKLQTVQMLSIDSLKLTRLDFIKIDIEGMEMEALQGAKNTIEACKPQLLIEKIKSDGDAISDFLTALGYKLFPIDINVLAVHESDPACEQIKIV